MRAHHLFNQLMIGARPEPENELFDIHVDISVRGKGRPRAGHVTPQSTREWTDYVACCVREQMEGLPPINFPFSAKLLYARSSKRLPDMDNIEKIVWDALHRGDKSGLNRAFEDDRLMRGHAEVAELLDTGEDFLWVRFYARRREDMTNYMEKYNERRHGMSATF